MRRALGWTSAPRWHLAIAAYARLLKDYCEETLYLHLVSQWDRPLDLVLGGHLHAPSSPTGPSDFMARIQYLDTLTYLPDDEDLEFPQIR